MLKSGAGLGTADAAQAFEAGQPQVFPLQTADEHWHRLAVSQGAESPDQGLGRRRVRT